MTSVAAPRKLDDGYGSEIDDFPGWVDRSIAVVQSEWSNLLLSEERTFFEKVTNLSIGRRAFWEYQQRWQGVITFFDKLLSLLY